MASNSSNPRILKRLKMSEKTPQEEIYNHVVEQLIVIHNSFNEKVKHLEAKIDYFVTSIKNSLVDTKKTEKTSHCCKEVLEKLDGIEQMIAGMVCKKELQDRPASDAPVVLLPTKKPQVQRHDDEGRSTIKVIVLNSESDYPNGSWLGNEHNHEARVRVQITSSQLLDIHNRCPTPEKMAVVLLDYLFTQETLARSNLSGKGKHFKEQLDPLKIFGIKVHLMHKFNITENDWHRIKQNIDSKCRFAWRKRAQGRPLSKNKVNETPESSDKIIRSNSIVLAGSFITEDDSQDLPSMIIEEDDHKFTLAGCEQTITIITDSGDEVNVPVLNAEVSLSDDHSAEDMLDFS